MPTNESAGAYTPTDNRGTDSTTDSYTADTESSNTLPTAVTDFRVSDAEKPADRPTVADEVAQDAWTGLCELIEQRRTLPTYVRSSHLDEFCSERRSVIGRALDLLARTDDVPLQISRWNDSDCNNAAIWRVEHKAVTDGGTSVDGDLLDALHTVLKERYEKRYAGDIETAEQQAITSSELADRITGEDAEANPKTREAVKVLMRERGLPVIGSHAGYYIPLERQPIEDELDALAGRIDGIKERQDLLERNWENWQRRQAEYQASFVDHSDDAVEQTTDGGEDIPEEVLEKIDEDPLLTVEDYLEHNGGGRA